MAALIENDLDTIKALCKKHRVKSLYPVRSATQENRFTDESDVDFLYKFNRNEIDEMAYADNFFDLIPGIKDLLHRRVDLATAEKMWNPYFIESIVESKQMIYEP